MHRLNNLTMHLTSTSIGLTTRREAEAVRFLMRPTGDAYQLTRALAGAFWTYAQLFSLVVDELVPEAKEEFSKRHDDWQFCFHPPLDEETARRTGRDDPCPCGSNRKFKHCHGSS
jgi:hypothetical protein